MCVCIRESKREIQLEDHSGIQNHWINERVGMTDYSAGEKWLKRGGLNDCGGWSGIPTVIIGSERGLEIEQQ